MIYAITKQYIMRFDAVLITYCLKQPSDCDHTVYIMEVYHFIDTQSISIPIELLGVMLLYVSHTVQFSHTLICNLQLTICYISNAQLHDLHTFLYDAISLTNSVFS